MNAQQTARVLTSACFTCGTTGHGFGLNFIPAAFVIYTLWGEILICGQNMRSLATKTSHVTPRSAVWYTRAKVSEKFAACIFRAVNL